MNRVCLLKFYLHLTICGYSRFFATENCWKLNRVDSFAEKVRNKLVQSVIYTAASVNIYNKKLRVYLYTIYTG